MSIMDKLKNFKNKNSTKKVYLSIWRKFNNFVIKLDRIPRTWEERVGLYIAHLVYHGAQSSTVKTYISAIKSILIDDDYQWDQSKILFSTLTRACRLINDRVRMRLPIKKCLMELLLHQISLIFDIQPYLKVLYQCMFCFAYYGLLRIGEITTGNHPIRARNVHMGENKNKIMMVLFTSKTHGLGSYPQKITISNDDSQLMNAKSVYDPFEITREYSSLRGDYDTENDSYFVF